MEKLKKLVISFFILYQTLGYGQSFLTSSRIDIEKFDWSELGLTESKEFSDPLVTALNQWLVEQKTNPEETFFFLFKLKKLPSTTQNWDKVWQFDIELELKRLSKTNEVIISKEPVTRRIKLKLEDLKAFNSYLASDLYRQAIELLPSLINYQPELATSVLNTELAEIKSYSEALQFCAEIVKSKLGQCNVESFSLTKTAVKITKISSLESLNELFSKLGYNVEKVQEGSIKLHRGNSNASNTK